MRIDLPTAACCCGQSFPSHRGPYGSRRSDPLFPPGACSLSGRSSLPFSRSVSVFNRLRRRVRSLAQMGEDEGINVAILAGGIYVLLVILCLVAVYG